MAETPAKTKRWTCPACGTARTTPFCSKCGEEPLRPRDLSSRDITTQILKAFTNIDGKLLRSFQSLLTRPGALTLAYIRGERRAYLGPLQLFLIANLLFFGMQTLTHTNIFSSPLASHLHHQDWSPLANELVAQKLAASHRTLAAYAPLFDQAVKLNAKALIILMALAFTPLLAILFHARHRPIGFHMVFSLHLYVFVLLLFCLSLAVVEIDLLSGGRGLESPAIDTALSLFNLGACAIYLYLMLGTVYNLRPVPRVAASLLLAIVLATLVLGYRFTIFLVTLYTS